jgi:hypothetical protein
LFNFTCVDSFHAYVCASVYGIFHSTVSFAGEWALMVVIECVQVDGIPVHHAATLVSTCYVQLLLAGSLLTLVIGALLHPQFWELVRERIWWPVSIALIVLWHVLTQKLLNTFVTHRKHIRRPFVWLFAYVALSAGYCTVRTPQCFPSASAFLFACIPSWYEPLVWALGFQSCVSRNQEVGHVFLPSIDTTSVLTLYCL